ncbi:MAG TPA: Rrf2 family transcriptional regulator [Phycisphaerales bacterium]|nr:Rrf2 family transcriptional regulator [Phycisphaerales bacterium]
MLSQTIEYALRAMTHLATLEPGASASSAVIAQHTQVPHGYLSKVLRDLVVADLITSQRGPNGGFTLARSAAEISIYDVVNAVDPMQRITECPLGNPDHVQLCPLHRRLDQAMDMVEREFRATSLGELLAPGRGPHKGCSRLTQLTRVEPNRKSGGAV